jgi:hypothetical protein
VSATGGHVPALATAAKTAAKPTPRPTAAGERGSTAVVYEMGIGRTRNMAFSTDIPLHRPAEIGSMERAGSTDGCTP